mgnify:CR=1 FL=1
MIKIIIAGLALGLLSTIAFASDVKPRPRSHAGECGIVEEGAGCFSHPTLEGDSICICPWEDITT